MARGRAGVTIEDLSVGTGAVATRTSTVRVHYTLRLNRGEVLRDTRALGEPERIDLRRREIVSEMRYGIEGMRVGGPRLVRAGPHLAYRDEGLTGVVPPDAVLVFEIELLDVLDTPSIP